MEKWYVVCNKENKKSKSVNLDSFVMKSGEKEQLASYWRNLRERAKRKGYEVTSGITEDFRVWAKFENDVRIIKLWFCSKKQAESMLVEI